MDSSKGLDVGLAHQQSAFDADLQFVAVRDPHVALAPHGRDALVIAYGTFGLDSHKKEGA